MTIWNGPTNVAERLYWYYIGKPIENIWNVKKWNKDGMVKVGRIRKNRVSLRPGNVYRVAFVNKNDKDDRKEIDGYWNGMVDAFGKITLIEAKLENPRVFYLFYDEFESVQLLGEKETNYFDKEESTRYVLFEVSLFHDKGVDPNTIVKSCKISAIKKRTGMVASSKLLGIFDEKPQLG